MRLPTRTLPYVLGQLAIGVWLVTASRVLCAAGVSLSGVLDDASFVLLLGALQLSLPALAGSVRALRAPLAFLPSLLATALFFVNEGYFRFFHTTLNLAAFQLAGIAADAATSITEIMNTAQLVLLLVVPLAGQGLVLFLSRGRAPAPAGRVAAGLACGGLLLAGGAGATRSQVYIFADQSPPMSLVREAALALARPFRGDPGAEREQILSLFNREGWDGYAFSGSDERPLWQEVRDQLPEPGDRRNVVLVLMESMRGLEMQGRFRELPVTPKLNALEGRALVFPNFYYNGMTTVDAEFSILCSALPLVNAAPVYIENFELDIRCLPEILQERGWDTHWISAYRASYANKRRFLRRHGVQQVHDIRSMNAGRTRHPKVGWGMGDVDMFEQALEKIDGFREPFFTEIMTLSNHHPFDHDYDMDFPDFSGVRADAHYRSYLKGMHYTDAAVGRFLEEAATRPWFSRTLFVILGDHAVRAYPRPEELGGLGPVLETEIYFRGRLLLYGPGWLEPGRVDALGSQIDVAPTLLDVLGLRADQSFMGVSLLADLPHERRFAFMGIGHVWNMRVGDHYCYSVGYSCFEKVFPRCKKGVEPTFEGHTCFESAEDLLGSGADTAGRHLDPLERHRILDRAERIIDVNRRLIREDRFR